MDEAKINTSLSDLFHFLTKELHVDLPLCQNNPNNSVKIRFNSLDASTAKEIAKEIIQATIGDSLFWVCEYGSISGETFSKIGLMVSHSDVFVIPYHSELIDPDWFEYSHDAISCVETCLCKFDVDLYIDYCFRLDFLSNSIYIVSPTRKSVIFIYDRRVMDIATTDSSILQKLRKQYNEFLK